MTEDVGCHTFSWKLGFVIFVFENKSIISDVEIFCTYFASVCDSKELMWFNLNWQFWLWASCAAEVEQEYLIIGAGTTAQGRRDARFSA